MTLAQLVLIAILSVVRAPAVDIQSHAEQARLVRLANDIAYAAELHDGVPFRGPARRQALALFLVTMAKHEGDFSWKVATCRLTGDRMPWHKPDEGRSISLFQLMSGKSWDGHTRREICTNQALAAYLAAKVLRLYSQSSYGGMFNGYASGNGGLRTVAARKRCATWERLAAQAGLSGAKCWGRQEITAQ